MKLRLAGAYVREGPGDLAAGASKVLRAHGVSGIDTTGTTRMPRPMGCFTCTVA
jgi:hypothetical protein